MSVAPRTKSSAAGVRGVRRCPVAADGEVEDYLVEIINEGLSADVTESLDCR